MLESTCDAVIIRALNPELLDTGEVLKERVLWNNLLLSNLKNDMQFLQGGKLCREHAGYFHYPVSDIRISETRCTQSETWRVVVDIFHVG